jgi:hypothetical protein
MIKVVHQDGLIESAKSPFKLQEGDTLMFNGKISDFEFTLGDNVLIIRVNGEPFIIENTNILEENTEDFSTLEELQTNKDLTHTALAFEEDGENDSIVDSLEDLFDLGKTAAGDEQIQQDLYFPQFYERDKKEENTEVSTEVLKPEDDKEEVREIERSKSSYVISEKDEIINPTKENTFNTTSVVNSDVIAEGDEDATITFSHEDILNTLYDADNNILEIGNVSVNIGTLTNEDGQYSLELPQNFNGDIEISYEATDGNSVVNGTSYINVNAINDEPVLTITDAPLNDEGTIEINEDSQATFTIDLSDIDGDNVSFTVNQPENGQIIVDGTEITYISNEDYNGPDSISISYTDGVVQKENILNIDIQSVNDVPVISIQDEVHMIEGQVQEILFDISDDSSNTTEATEATEATSENGVVIVDGGMLIYTPNLDFNGDDVISVTVTNEFGEQITKEIPVSVDNDNADYSYTIEHNVVQEIRPENVDVIDEEANKEAGYYQETKEVRTEVEPPKTVIEVPEVTEIRTETFTNTREVDGEDVIGTRPTNIVDTEAMIDAGYVQNDEGEWVTRTEEVFTNTRIQQQEVEVELQRQVIDSEAMKEKGYTLNDDKWETTETEEFTNYRTESVVDTDNLPDNVIEVQGEYFTKSPIDSTLNAENTGNGTSFWSNPFFNSNKGNDNNVNGSNRNHDGKLNGTDGRDDISIGSGDRQTINAGAEDDFIETGRGHDTVINADDGDDFIEIKYTNYDRTIINGGTGDDVISYKSDSIQRDHRIDGGEGNDTVIIPGNSSDFQIVDKGDGSFSINSISSNQWSFWSNGDFRIDIESIENIVFKDTQYHLEGNSFVEGPNYKLIDVDISTLPMKEAEISFMDTREVTVTATENDIIMTTETYTTMEVQDVTVAFEDTRIIETPIQDDQIIYKMEEYVIDDPAEKDEYTLQITGEEDITLDFDRFVEISEDSSKFNHLTINGDILDRVLISDNENDMNNLLANIGENSGNTKKNEPNTIENKEEVLNDVDLGYPSEIYDQMLENSQIIHDF